MLLTISNHIHSADRSVRVLVSEILKHIESGNLYPGYQFPLVKEQAVIFRVSRFTINRVIKELMELGAVISSKKRIYVSKPKKDLLQLDFGHPHPAHVQEFQRFFAVRTMPTVPSDGNRRQLIEKLLVDKYHAEFPFMHFENTQLCFYNSWSMAMILIGKMLDAKSVAVDGIMESPLTRSLSLFSKEVIMLGERPEGMDIHRFRGLCRAGRVSVLVFAPRVRCPFGAPMDQHSIAEILQIVEQYHIPLVEVDLCDGLCYGETPYEPVALRALQKGLNAVYLRPLAPLPVQTLFSPVIIAREELICQLRLHRLAVEVDMPQFENAAFDMLLNKDFAKKVVGMREEYRMKRDYLYSRLTSFANREYSVSLPVGGLSVWVSLPEEISQRAFCSTLREMGVAVPDYYYYARPYASHHGIKIGFATLDRPAMNRVAACIHAAVTKLHNQTRPMRRA
ncbi:MAG: GntR family transcriptional regulator [Candidatus Pseudobacter hemicellulosilyticus]|uniref:GntR family transcriptional regulator n=1 Tax=Candidatus Pseudobacter hemicellulosilyticus TaxID=3121375 RepID=A0AAJ5WV12_9BACT|nr:MAG: GntR family transcriptional regulator [Pseudobacter sp.]